MELMLSLLCSTRDNFDERRFCKAAFFTFGIKRGVGKTGILSNCACFLKKGLFYLSALVDYFL